MLELLALPPIFRGLVAMMAGGACFPLCGVLVLRLDLVPLRYLLMHGVILGGAVSLALSLPLVPVTVAVNLLLIGLMLALGARRRQSMSGAGAATMVLAMAAASVITHLADVPAKDTLDLLWGSPFALSRTDLFVLAGLCVLLVGFLAATFRSILALFFDPEVARSLGIPVGRLSTSMVLLVAVVVALAMKLIGAFLIDALLVLPVLAASRLPHRGVRQVFAASSLCGFVSATAGYLLAVAIGWPPSGTIAIISTLLYAGASLIARSRSCANA